MQLRLSRFKALLGLAAVGALVVALTAAVPKDGRDSQELAASGASVTALDYAGPVARLGSSTAPLAMAHRGGVRLAPENTLPAFEAALSGGLRWIEADLRRTADGRIVVIHDDDVKRTTNGKGRVDRLTFDEFRALDAGSWFGPEYEGTQVPELGELLDLIRDHGANIMLELKGYWTPQSVHDVGVAIRDRELDAHVAIASFHRSTLEAARDVLPALPRILLRSKMTKHSLVIAQELGASAIGTSPEGLRTLRGSSLAIREAGLGLLLYTINTAEGWRGAINSGATIIVSNDPLALDAWLDRVRVS